MRDDLDRERLVAGVGETSTRHGWICLAYCLLDTHFHLIVRTPEANLGAGMQRLLSRYAAEFNKRYERVGNLFHTRFYSTEIRSEEHLSSALVYVILNPVRAGLTDRAEKWRWSSYPGTLGIAAAPSFLATDATLELVDGNSETARRQLRAAVREARARDRAILR